MQDKDTDIELKKQAIDPEMDNHIIGSIREGRKPGLQDAEYWEQTHNVKIDIFLNRVEYLLKLHQDEFGLNNKSTIEKIILSFKKNNWKRNIVLGRLEDSKEKHITIDDLYISLLRNGLKISKDDLRSLIASNAIGTFHPFDKYLNKLDSMQFDASVDYFKKLAEFIITDNPVYFAGMLKKHFIRTIDQYKRNVPNRYVFVNYGGQDLGKSLFTKWLNPLGDNYYSEQPLRGDKDCEILLATVLFYVIEELEGLSKQDVTKTKTFISRALVKERKPYGSEAIAMSRLASIFASTNDREFLTDIINTRWLVFEVKEINHDYNNLKTGRKDIDVNSLWWQAYNEWKVDNSAGMLTTEEKELQASINKNYNISTPEYHLILKHIRISNETDKQKEETQFPGNGSIEFLSSTDILIRLTGLYPTIKINSAWLGREMKRAGFESRVIWINGKSLRGYDVVWSESGFKNRVSDELPF